MNEEQAFQIIVEGNTYRYFKGDFYKTGIPSDYNWLEDFFDEYELALPTSTKKINEKGKKEIGTKSYKSMWDPNSLFYLVAKKGENITNTSTIKTLLQEADYIICTDLQSEIADFITISEKQIQFVSFTVKQVNPNCLLQLFKRFVDRLSKILIMLIKEVQENLITIIGRRNGLTAIIK
ncbi:hypothetical protein CXF51_22390 [Bacillus subtilis subsp. subtilis]|nr:hypothetical protein CXF51_22390 [Bacillus subtilis subsp. subtilis]